MSIGNLTKMIAKKKGLSLAPSNFQTAFTMKTGWKSLILWIKECLNRNSNQRHNLSIERQCRKQQ